MCIIIAKNKSGRLPSVEELKNSFEYNNDGAGFMYVKNNKVVIDKGYMEWSEFIARFFELCDEFNNFKKKSLVIHCRIGTSSGNIPENTHPYPISENVKDLHKLYVECDLGMAHNGIISEYTPTNKKSKTNDTQEFILKYVAPLYSKWNDFYKNKYILSGLEDITGSKLVFMDTNDKLYYVGDFVEDNGLYFSNTSYRSYKYVSTYTYGKNQLVGEDENYDWYGKSEYGDAYDYYDGDKWYLDSEWYISCKGKYEKVGDRDLMWDWSTLELFEYKEDLDEFVKIADDVIAYDETGTEIY